MEDETERENVIDDDGSSADEAIFCHKCSLAIDDDVLVPALDAFYHTKCFTCDTCQSALETVFYERDGKPYCVTDFMLLCGQVCVGCSSFITGPMMVAGTSAFHPECFSCRHCRRLMGVSEEFASRDDALYCNDCFEIIINRSSSEVSATAPPPPPPAAAAAAGPSSKDTLINALAEQRLHQPTTVTQSDSDLSACSSATCLLPAADTFVRGRSQSFRDASMGAPLDGTEGQCVVRSPRASPRRARPVSVLSSTSQEPRRRRTVSTMSSLAELRHRRNSPTGSTLTTMEHLRESPSPLAPQPSKTDTTTATDSLTDAQAALVIPTTPTTTTTTSIASPLSLLHRRKRSLTNPTDLFSDPSSSPSSVTALPSPSSRPPMLRRLEHLEWNETKARHKMSATTETLVSGEMAEMNRIIESIAPHTPKGTRAAQEPPADDIAIFGTSYVRRPRRMIGEASVFCMDDLLIGDVIGEGFFGRVFRVTHRESGTVMVLKEMKQTDEEARAVFLKEMSILKSLHHPNILEFLGLFVKDRCLHLMTAYVGGGHMRMVIDRNASAAGVPLTWPLRMAMAHDIARGISYLHFKHIIHRDLTSTNCLVHEDSLSIVVADFGLARSTVNVKPGERLPIEGSPYWMAPEMLRGKIYDERVDVFSYGIVLCELISRCAAHPDELPRTGDFGLDIPAFRQLEHVAGCPEEFLQLAFECCAVDPSARPTPREISARLHRMRYGSSISSSPPTPAPTHAPSSPSSNLRRTVLLSQSSPAPTSSLIN